MTHCVSFKIALVSEDRNFSPPEERQTLGGSNREVIELSRWFENYELGAQNENLSAYLGRLAPTEPSLINGLSARLSERWCC